MDKILFSSVSKKFVMALAGIFLLLFLPIHLVINMMLLQGTPEVYNKAASFMATFPLIKILEMLLMLAILVHVAWGIYIQIQNWLARPVRYVKPVKAETSFFSRFMIWNHGPMRPFAVG